MILALAGCASIIGTSKLTYAPEVRRQSSASDVSFHDLLTAIGGVGYVDRAAFPDSKERALVRVEVLSPCGDQKIGSERWTIRHDDNASVVYQVILFSDEDGSTDFDVIKAQ
jgi:hypothetical protein